MATVMRPAGLPSIRIQARSFPARSASAAYRDSGCRRGGDYLSELMGAYFRVTDLDAFEPPIRYLTYAQLVARWKTKLSEDEAVALIRASVSEGSLIAGHPTYGYTVGCSLLPVGEGWPPLESGVFEARQVEAIEANTFGLRPAEAKAKTTIDAERACRQWLVGVMSNGARKAYAKELYLAQAQREFMVSDRAFERAWRAAITETGNAAWSLAGRSAKKSQPS